MRLAMRELAWMAKCQNLDAKSAVEEEKNLTESCVILRSITFDHPRPEKM